MALATALFRQTAVGRNRFRGGFRNFLRLGKPFPMAAVAFLGLLVQGRNSWGSNPEKGVSQLPPQHRRGLLPLAAVGAGGGKYRKGGIKPGA